MSADLERLAPELRGLLDRLDASGVDAAEDRRVALNELRALADGGDAEAQRLYLNVLCLMWKDKRLTDGAYARLAIPTARLAARRSNADAFNLAGLLAMRGITERSEGRAADADLSEGEAVALLDALSDEGHEWAGEMLASLSASVSPAVLKLADMARRMPVEPTWEELLASLPPLTWRDRACLWWDRVCGRCFDARAGLSWKWWVLRGRIAGWIGGY